MKSAIPWVLVAALLAGGWFLFSQGRDKDAKINQLQAENQEIAPLRAENEELRKATVEAGEFERLRKDNEELLKLRSEVSGLRNTNQQLRTQVQTAQAQRTQAQQEAQAQQQAAARARAEGAAREQAASQAQTQGAAQAQANACINNLRILDGVKQQWALESKATATAIPTVNNISPYFGTNALPACPVGGTYSLNNLATVPTCNVPGHALTAAVAR